MSNMRMRTLIRSRVAGPLFAAALLMSHGAVWGDQVYRILPLGDSITQAEINRASYRYPLWKKLLDGGVPFDFVGSLQKQQDRYSKGTPPQPDYRDQPFDRDHEGHFGWNIDEVLKGRDFDNGSGSGKLSEWVKGYDADIALIHLGTNDAFNRHPNESTVEELKKVIEILREDNPKTVILLATLIPASRKPGDAAAVESLNELIPRVAEIMSTEESPVVLVDQFSGFNAEKHTYDGVHPNEAGEERMAEVWFEAIARLVAQRR